MVSLRLWDIWSRKRLIKISTHDKRSGDNYLAGELGGDIANTCI